MEDDRKQRLAIALEKEKNNLPEYNIFGSKNDTSGYDDAIEYLKTGNKPYNYEDNDLLLCCVDNFEMMCSDYGID